MIITINLWNNKFHEFISLENFWKINWYCKIVGIYYIYVCMYKHRSLEKFCNNKKENDCSTFNLGIFLRGLFLNQSTLTKDNPH